MGTNTTLDNTLVTVVVDSSDSSQTRVPEDSWDDYRYALITVNDIVVSRKLEVDWVVSSHNNNNNNNSTARVQRPGPKNKKNEPSLFRFCLLTTNPK